MIATITLNPSLDEWVTLPSLRLGALNRAQGFARYPGGKGINVSRVMHELGADTVAFALAGGDDGMIFRRLVERVGLRLTLVAVDGTTRNNYKIRATAPNRLTEINTPGPRVSARVLQVLRRRLFHLRPRPQGLVFSGSLPPGAPPSIYQRWIRHARRLGIPAVLDASGEALRLGVKARPWMMKPNRQEAEELLGLRLARRAQMVQAVRRLARAAEVVVLSLGKDGALLARGEGVWHAAPPRVAVDSAVGAGDSLVGGMVAGWMWGQPLLDAFRLGVASGAATAMTPGTELCHRADVRRLLSRVVIRRVG